MPNKSKLTKIIYISEITVSANSNRLEDKTLKYQQPPV